MSTFNPQKDARRCEAQDRTDRWPYVKRCIKSAKYLRVPVMPLEDDLDLCHDHLLDYIETLPISEAQDLVVKHAAGDVSDPELERLLIEEELIERRVHRER